ncbi:structural maintenance of chromosomes protein 5 [Anopheles maculipalpis]|uniref:structural maintenance of chromosomes protein 5 n=1 Tax=Anopheles maculipalpis TaxID=1496333 RepID=UPI002158C980|nr:structural maintenance of chromosomes protein 5 [Anopheles maculipalpis]
MTDSVVGKIASISLKDFVTYDSVVLYPDDYLNIILGPNGTGKSAIVAGIVLGMGGNCKLLSRCDNIDSYIKNGKESATIRISIYCNGERGVQWFSRSFNHDRVNTFKIDDNVVSHQAYLQKIRAFNIQVDNLCQFLPQDRVQDFTKMNPRELLINTQSSVCATEVQEWFKELKEKRALQQKCDAQVLLGTDRVREMEARLADLEQQLETLHAREEFQQQIDICLARKIWLEYEELYLQYTAILKDLTIAKKMHDDKELEYNKCKADMETIMARKQQLENSKAAQVSIAQRCTSDIRRLEEKMERLEDSTAKQKRDLTDALAKAQEQKSELEEAKVVLAAFVQDCADALAAVGSEEEVRQKISDLFGQESKIREEDDLLRKRHQKLNQKIETDLKPEMINLERNIATIEDVANTKLKILQTRFEGTYRAVLWLRENEHLFQGKIYEPMVLELNVPNLTNVPFLENTIGVRDLIAFTCENTEDMNLFLRKTREEMRIEGVNAIQSDPADRLHYKPRYPIDSLKQFGFHTYLIDMLEAPFPVLNGLCKLYGLQNIPVGGADSAKHVSSLPDEIAVFFTPSHRFQVSKSRYTGEKSTRSDALTAKQLLNRSTDHALLAQKRQQLLCLVRECDKIRNARGQIESNSKKLQERCTKIQQEKRELQEHLQKSKQAKVKVMRQEQRCTVLTARQINVDEERSKYERSCSAIIKQLLEELGRRIEALERYAAAVREHELLEHRIRIFEQCNNDREANFRVLEDAYQSAQKTLANVKKKLADVKEKTSKKNNSARALTQNKTPDKPDFPYKQEFAQLPSTIESLDKHLEELRVRFECLPQGNQQAVAEHEQMQQLLVQLRSGVANTEQEKASLEQDMAELHERWYPEIQRVVLNINKKFSHFMGSMGFAGEIELIRQVERDYDEYGIRIHVKYRNEEKLSALDRKLQSGGERAVAIAIYTLSLQHMTQVPFRCVDEINQGMDPTNERKVFNMLVDETCREGQSQYFFVTPKLLPRLKYNDKMTVLIVHNGKYIENPDVFLANGADGRA